MTKTRIAGKQRLVKPDRIRAERKKLRSKSKTTDPERYPVMKRGSQTDRNWSKVHVDVFQPGEPPYGLKFNSSTQNVYFRLIVLMFGHRTWIPKNKTLYKKLQLSERRVRFQLQILKDLRLIEVVPIGKVDSEYVGCREAILVLDLPDWYFFRPKEGEEEAKHYREAANRHKQNTLRVVP